MKVFCFFFKILILILVESLILRLIFFVKSEGSAKI